MDQADLEGRRSHNLRSQLRNTISLTSSSESCGREKVVMVSGGDGTPY